MDFQHVFSRPSTAHNNLLWRGCVITKIRNLRNEKSRLLDSSLHFLEAIEADVLTKQLLHGPTGTFYLPTVNGLKKLQKTKIGSHEPICLHWMNHVVLLLLWWEVACHCYDYEVAQKPYENTKTKTTRLAEKMKQYFYTTRGFATRLWKMPSQHLWLERKSWYAFVFHAVFLHFWQLSKKVGQSWFYPVFCFPFSMAYLA